MQFISRVLAAMALVCLASQAPAQEMFSVFVPSAPENVERMLKIAKLRDSDVVVDLGSGDGRIVLGAARLNPKIRGWGVDVDAKLVQESNAEAEKEGIAGRVRFFHRNVFDADLSRVDVIFMWLFPELQRLLRTKIFAEARPGTRVVTNLWDMGSWPPQEVDEQSTKVFLYVVPARFEGNWSWSLPLHGRKQTYAAVLERHFQNGEGVVRTGSRRGILHDVKANGEELSFSLLMTVEGVGYVRHEFSGKVQGNRIHGKARLLMPKQDDREEYETVEMPWQAVRTKTSAYYAKTGLPKPP